MTPAASPSLRERTAAILLAAAVLATYSIAQHSQMLWLLLPGLASAFWQLRRLPRLGLAGARHAAVALLVVTALTGFVVTLYPVVPENVTGAILRGSAWALAGLATFFLFSAALAPFGRTGLPSLMGVLLAAAVLLSGEQPTLVLHRLVFVPLAAVLIHGVLTESTLAPRRPSLRLRAWRWARLAVTIAGIVAVALAIGRFLPWAQPQVEQATANMLSSSASSAMTGFGNQTRLGEIEELALSRRLVLRLWTDVPQNLRLRVCTRFDGRVWRKAPKLLPSHPLPPATGPIEPGLRNWIETIPGVTYTANSGSQDGHSPLIRTKVVQSLFLGNQLPSPAQPRLVRAADQQMQMDASELLGATQGALELYGIANAGAPRAAAGPEPAFDEELTLPEVIDPRLRALAGELSLGAPTAQERVARTVGYLQGHCRYALRVGQFKSQDPVAEFVFDKRRGYCEYFASAAALLLRLQGVPTRYVTGLSVRPANFVAGHYVVRESDAHAWIEAYIAGVGWSEADATPAGDYAEVHRPAASSWAAAIGEWLQAAWAALSASLRQASRLEALLWVWRQLLAGLRFPIVDHPVWGAGACLVLLLLKRGWLARVVRRRPRAAGRPAIANVPPELLRALAQLERLWARLKCPRPVTYGLLEHAEALPPERASATVRKASLDVARAYYRASFGGIDPSQSDLAELCARVERLA